MYSYSGQCLPSVAAVTAQACARDYPAVIGADYVVCTGSGPSSLSLVRMSPSTPEGVSYTMTYPAPAACDPSLAWDNPDPLVFASLSGWAASTVILLYVVARAAGMVLRTIDT